MRKEYLYIKSEETGDLYLVEIERQTRKVKSKKTVQELPEDESAIPARIDHLEEEVQDLIDWKEQHEQEGGDIAPDTVGSEEIKDGSIKVEDLDDEVKEGLDELNNIAITDEELEDIFQGETPETEEAGAAEDSVEGGGADLDNL